MGAAATIGGVCADLGEAVFELRQAIPPTWQGPAAEEFAGQIEEVAARAGALAQDLGHAARLTHFHELHMRALRLAMSGQPG